MEIKIYHRTESNNIIRDSGYLLDPFSEEEVWIYKNQIYRYFEENYNLQMSQVWNLVHNFDKDQKHYCPTCGQELSYIKSDIGFGTYCSQSCQVYGQWSDPEFREKRSSKVSQDLIERWKDHEYYDYMISRILSKESIASRNYTRFINETDDLECYFYLAISKTLEYKFGITKDLKYRQHTGNYKSIKSLFVGSKYEVAELEFNLVMKLGSEWIIDIKRFNKEFRIEVQRLVERRTLK